MKRYIKPAKPGLVVRQPHNARPLPDDGAEVEWNSHWMRRLADGSVVKATPPKTPKAKPASAATAEKEAD